MYQSRILTVLFIESFFKILRKLGLRGSLLVALSQFQSHCYYKMLINTPLDLQCTSVFFFGGGGAGEGVGAYSRLGAY